MRLLRYLSIDIALGALACGVMVQWLLGVVMPPFWYVVLPACVWLIYTGDHLLDAKRLGKVTDSPRHTFHIQHYSQIQSAFFVILVVTGILAVIGLGIPILFFGALAGGLVGLYFLIAHVFRLKAGAWFQKELIVAVLYALGIWGGPLAVKQGGLSVLELVLIFQLILLAFMNLLTLSIYEHEWDKKTGQLSMINQLGIENGTKRVYMIGFCVLVLSVLLGAQSNINT